MKQNKLTFKTQFRRDMGPLTPLPDSWKMDAVIQEHELKNTALRKGYITRNVRSFLAIVTICDAAKANWPKAEREKAQKTIDEAPAPTSIQFRPK